MSEIEIEAEPDSTDALLAETPCPMPNGKNKVSSIFPIMGKQASFRYQSNRNICIGVSFVVLLLFICFGPLDFQSSINGMQDRSDTYKVKVIPSSLDDSALNGLPKDTFSYLAMIDAGSSGCRAHVYRYGKLGSLEGPLYVLPQHVSKKIKPGLSSFAENPQDAGKSLTGLVDFIKTQVGVLFSTDGYATWYDLICNFLSSSLPLFLSSSLPLLLSSSLLCCLSVGSRRGLGINSYLVESDCWLAHAGNFQVRSSVSIRPCLSVLTGIISFQIQTSMGKCYLWK